MRSSEKETSAGEQDPPNPLTQEIKRGLVPFYGTKPPKKAHKEALKYLKKGATLYLLHIVDTAPVKLMRSDTGQIGERSKIIRTFEKSLRETQEEAAQKYVEEVKKDTAKKGVSIKDIYAEGDPAEEVLGAVEKYSIDIVIIERLRGQIPEIFFGAETNYIEKRAPCKVKAVNQ